MTATFDFGAFEGKTVRGVSFESPSGNLRATVHTYGGTLQSFTMFDAVLQRHVQLVLGYDALAPYTTPPFHIGATVGRYANRIANATFPAATIGAVEPIVLPANNNDKHNLHGGPGGFSRRVWDSIEPITHAEMLKMSAPSASVASAELGGDKVVGATLTIHSPDGDQGFPCALDATARYYFDADDAFVIVLSATNRGARPTVCSMTNHAYWNLAGYAEQPRVAAALPAPDDSAPPSVMDHLMHAPNATFYLPADAFAIPTGEVLSTRGTALDFATAARLLHAGADDAMLDPGLPSKAGFDHCLVLAGGPPGVDRHAATLTDPASGRSMEVATTLPAVQIYSGNYLPRCVGHGGAVFGYRSAVCLETQLFPDSPNRGHFPTSTLRAGETFCHTTRHRFRPSTSRTQ